ncbi:uncharacterized protein LOC141592630 [Silene latifolia]|uniref:uncharacterized protein LOC141592630 n=1 Tax=Silene latifolia TaxID=37657 RepID=UPI003D7846D4
MFTTKGKAVQKTSSNGVVAVAIDKDKNCQYALRWAIDNLISDGRPIVLIHVIVDPSFRVSNNVTLARSQGTSPNIQFVDKQTKELFLAFRSFFNRKGEMRSLDIVLRDTDVAKALSEYVSYAAIENLVLGASRGGLIRKFKQADIPTMVSREAPDFCNVYVISKSTISPLRKASRSAPFQSPLKSNLDRLMKGKSSIVEPVDSPPRQSLCITESVRPQITVEYLMEQRRRKAARSLLKLSSREKTENEPSLNPIKETLMATLQPSTSVTHAASLDSTLIQFPAGFGCSENVPNWPHLSQLLLPGPASALEQKAPPEVADQTVENLFVAMQSALHSRKVITRMRTKFSAMNAKNAELKNQLTTSINKKKATQDHLRRTQEVNCSLLENLKVTVEQVLLLKKTLAKAVAFAAWESKIKCIKDFQNGKHLTWDLEEEERMFAHSFMRKPDLSILGDFELEDSDDETDSTSNNAATCAGTSVHPDPVVAPATIPAEKDGWSVD